MATAVFLCVESHDGHGSLLGGPQTLVCCLARSWICDERCLAKCNWWLANQ